MIIAAATAFFTTFSLAPILVLLVTTLGLYFKSELIQERLLSKLQETFGEETASQIEKIVFNISGIEHDWLFALTGFAFLLFIATNLMRVIKQSINKMWQIQRKHSSHLQYNFAERFVAAFLILATGILVIFSISLDTTLALLRDQLAETVPAFEMSILRSLNILFSIFVVSLWFTILFKILPDAKLHWRVALTGGLITALLFNSGKWILGKLLLYNTIADIFGASASFALILLFIFYASLILYLGAAFTYAFAAAIKKPIHPGKYSEVYEVHLLQDTDEKEKLN
jgi:membrane protein